MQYVIFKATTKPTEQLLRHKISYKTSFKLSFKTDYHRLI